MSDRAIEDEPLPLARPWTGEEELRALGRVLQSGRLVQGPRGERFEACLAELTGRRFAVTTSSGTTALEVALEAMGVGPGDEVLVPAFGWPSPAHAALRRGATVVLVDVDPDDWNVSPEALAAARTARSRLALLVDQYGVPLRTEALAPVLEGLRLLEDAACGLGSRLADGRTCGALGEAAILSFHPRKVVTTGEGGAVLTDESALAERLRALRDHGRLAGRFRWAGGNHRLSELAAALGLVQLERLEAIVSARAALAEHYRQRLAALPVRLQRVPGGVRWNAQTFGVVLPDGWSAADRDRLRAWLQRRHRIETGLLGHALHRLPSLRHERVRPGGGDRGLTVSEALADRGLALPLFPQMPLEAVDRVAEALYEGLRSCSPAREEPS